MKSHDVRILSCHGSQGVAWNAWNRRSGRNRRKGCKQGKVQDRQLTEVSTSVSAKLKTIQRKTPTTAIIPTTSASGQVVAMAYTEHEEKQRMKGDEGAKGIKRMLYTTVCCNNATLHPLPHPISHFTRRFSVTSRSLKTLMVYKIASKEKDAAK